MRKKGRIWITLYCLMVFSFMVTGIGTIQDEIEEKTIVSAENISLLDSNEGMHEFVDKPYDGNEMNLESTLGNTNDKNDKIDQSVFAETASQNTGALNDITGGTPVLVSVPETSTLELNAKLEQLSSPPHIGQFESHDNRTQNISEPVVDAGITEEKFDLIRDTENVTDVPLNQTSDKPEDIPSFSEWAQKRLEEAEKNEEVLNQSVQHSAGSTSKSGSGVKLGWKNYASPDCGAKVVAANSEAVSPSSVISPSREEYKLNVCTNRIWFIIELCEAIQAKKVDIANFELFSSNPKDFTVSIGDRFPSREWSTVGQFTAKDERDVQSFDLNPYLFGRYIKVEIKSHHGSQHYCPISLFRVYGTSELEVLQKEELSHSDEDDDVDDDESLITNSDDIAKNMLNSATNAVYSMIKKAAAVLGTKTNDTENENVEGVVKFEYSPLINTCSTPCHRITCVNCSDVLFGQVYELLSCKSHQMYSLTDVPYIRRSLKHSDICEDFGLTLNKFNDRSTFNGSSRSVRSFFSYRILGAMCNILAISENKAVLNNSHQVSNTTKEFMENEHLTNIENSKVNLKIEQSSEVYITEGSSEIRPTEELTLDSTNNIDIPKATCSTDLSYISQIKPTRTVTKDVLVESSNIVVASETEEYLGHVTKTETPSNDATLEVEEKKLNSLDVDENQKTVDANNQPEITTESSENLDTIENFIDINTENLPPTAPSVSSNSAADRQKESVFLRLSNRIKALERNVSLSSQYLEELSRRYKKQVEEMQKLMEKTLQTVTEERKRMDERNKQLEERLENLMLMIGRWPSFLFWFFFTLAAACGVLWICNIERQKSQSTAVTNIERRKSIDVVPTNEKKTKVRRPSDQAMKIVRSSLITEERKLSREKRKRKRSNKGIKRSTSFNGEGEESEVRNGRNLQYLSNGHPQERLSTEGVQNCFPGTHVNSTNYLGDWVEENHRLLEIIPLDESEHSSLEQFSTIMEQDVPQYTKTAVDSRAHRLSSQLIKPNINGDSNSSLNFTRKSESLDGSFRFKNSLSRRSSKSSDGSQKKERRSFKNILKNYFS